MESQRTFTYIRMPIEKKKLFCLQQKMSELAWVLFFNTDSLTPIVRSDVPIFFVRSYLNRLRGFLGSVGKNIRFLCLFIGYKFQWVNEDMVVELPGYGQFCVPIHKGYKIFNVYKQVVIKVFDHDVRPAVIHEETELLKQVSKLEFAPSIKAWNIEERWYEEEYVQGTLDSSYTPMDSTSVRQKFSNEIVHPLTRIMLFQKLQSTHTVEYVLDIIRKVSRQTATGEDLHTITPFFDSIVDRLKAEGNDSIFLVFAHGDFVPANMLNTPKGMKLIDWEGAGYRSALFDFYSYFFYRPASRNVPVDLIVTEIKEALPRCISELATNAREVAQSLETLEHIYRWTFYIEMLARLMERATTDKNLNVRNSIIRYLESFDRYDATLAQQP